VTVLSKLFRGKLLALLQEAFHQDRLSFGGVAGFGNGVADDVNFKRLLRKAYRTKWVSYAKAPFAGPEAVYEYLGYYTHRVGISNHRLVSVTHDEVVFRTRDEDTATLRPVEFIRRLLLHILPRGFVKIRHYGLLAPGNVNKRLLTARALLVALSAVPASTPASAQEPSSPPTTSTLDWAMLLFRLTGIDLRRCQKCGGAVHAQPLKPLPKDTS
jgi:hypothetical protein